MKSLTRPAQVFTLIGFRLRSSMAVFRQYPSPVHSPIDPIIHRKIVIFLGAPFYPGRAGATPSDRKEDAAGKIIH